MAETVTLLSDGCHWTSGHPYLSQRVCKAVLETPEAKTPADVDVLVSRLYLGNAQVLMLRLFSQFEIKIGVNMTR